MNPQPNSSVVIIKRLLQLSLLGLSIIFLTKAVLIPSIAQSNERELEDTVPKHLPIRVKIKKEKEKAFKDLKNEKWLRDFELEITNIGDKPIYFLDLHVFLPEIRDNDGRHISFSLYYGRTALIDFRAKLQPDDVPIKPGETYVFSLAYKQQAWEAHKRKRDWPQPKTLQLKFQAMNFGDGSGFLGTTGIPFPKATKEKASRDDCEPPNKGGTGAPERRQAASSGWAKTSLMTILPTSFSPVFFSQSFQSSHLPRRIYNHNNVARVLTACSPRLTLKITATNAGPKKNLQARFVATHSGLVGCLRIHQTLV